MSTEIETAVAESNPTDTPPEKEGKSAKKSRKKGKKTASEKNIISRFAICGRCSYLLTVYRLAHDPADFATAVNNIKSGWLTLTWDMNMSKLVSHTYGVRFDIDAFFVEGCCPECRRVYMCKLDASDKKPTYFRIKI